MTAIRYLSVCSGIEAATVAWEPLGLVPLAFAEIASFPRRLLKHHYPAVPLYGDFTLLRDMDWIGQADWLIGGTPCQSFSIAGLRGGLSDARGNLTLEFVRLADAIDDIRPANDPAVIVWENVVGVLSSQDNAFGAFLAGLGGCDSPLTNPRSWPGAGVVAGPRRIVVWRTLDAKFFGVPQRRRRVFVVAISRTAPCGGWSVADALLPIGEGLQRHSAPGRPAWESTTGDTAAGADPNDRTVGTMTFAGGHGAGSMTGQDPYQGMYAFDMRQVARQTPDQNGPSPTIAKESRLTVANPLLTRNRPDSGPDKDNYVIAAPLSGHHHRGDLDHDTYIFGAQNSVTQGDSVSKTTCQTLDKSKIPGVMVHGLVRRLTPTECERLQAFPDGYTAIPGASDGARYAALGNSMCVYVVRWIGKRLLLTRSAEYRIL